LTSSLSSPLSADGFPSLFECFMGTMPLSDSSERAYGPYGLSLRPSACYWRRRPRGLPVLVQKVSRRVWGLRLRRTAQGLALAPLSMLPSAGPTASASRLLVFEAQYPAHLFPCLRFAARLTTPSAKLGAEWIATPFS